MPTESVTFRELAWDTIKEPFNIALVVAWFLSAVIGWSLHNFQSWWTAVPFVIPLGVIVVQAIVRIHRRRQP